MENKQSELAIVGIFWDGYYDIWEDFLELKEKFWKNCPYPLYIVNQTKNLSFSKKYDVTVINAGADAEYSKKVRCAIENINSKYLLLLLDDFFFTKPLDGPVLDDRIEFMKENHLNYYSMPLPEFLDECNGSSFKDQPYIQNIETSKEYTLSCQPALWEKNFLADRIGQANYNAWIFEGMYAKAKFSHTKEFLDQCKIDVSNILGLIHGALQGKMIPPTIEKLHQLGYDMKNTREVLPASAYSAHERKAKLKAYIPLCMQKLLKRVFKINSVTDKYKDAIVEQMNNLGIC